MEQNLDVAAILKELEEYIQSASRVPLTGKIIIDGEQVLSCVERIFAALPEELKQARQVLEQSDKLLESVEGQGKRIIQDAREQAMHLLQETEIYKEASQRAESLINQAEKASVELRHESVLYSDDVLSQLEANLEKILHTIKKNREDLQNFKYYQKPSE